jgi:glycine/D-amino acid oxidase-like deaminating enzyme
LEESGCYEYEWLDRHALNTIFPGIHPKVRGGVTIPKLQVEPFKYTLGLAQAAESMGAEIKHGEVTGFATEGERITAVELASGTRLEADGVVIAMGPWSGQAASLLGKEIPAHICMEECLRVRVQEGFPLHSIYNHVNLISRIDGDVIIASAQHESLSHYYESTKREDFDSRLTDSVKEKNIEAAMELIPDLLEASELVEHRGDLLAYGPDPIYQKPVLGRLQGWENGYIASRFGGMGIMMSVGVGEVMADLIVDSEVPFRVRKMIEHLTPE